MESWQVMNPLPYGHPITQDVYGKLFASVGRNESGVQSYFQCRGQRVLSTGLNLALDTTTFSTYSKNQIEARQGFNKDGDGLDTIKLLVLYRQPVAFSKQGPEIVYATPVRPCTSQTGGCSDSGAQASPRAFSTVKKDLEALARRAHEVLDARQQYRQVGSLGNRRRTRKSSGTSATPVLLPT